MPAGNTQECFSEFIGQKVVGVLFNALPVNRPDLQSGKKTLVFEDGRGLTISGSGSYWIDSAKDIAQAIRKKQRELTATGAELAGVLELAGVTDA